MTDVRLKLHATTSNGDIQNIWMSLNYDKKPTIGHLISQLKFNLNYDDDSLVNLYLDEYLLPIWENSRILRENDCIRAEISEKLVDFGKNKSPQIQSKNYYEANKQKQDNQLKLQDKNNLKNSVTTNDLNLKSINQQQQNQKSKKDDFFLNPLNKFTKSASSSSVSTSSSLPAVNKNSKQQASNNQPKKTNTSSNDLNKNAKNSSSFATHKKFSVGSYIHLLNEAENENPQEDVDDWDEEDEIKVEKYDDKRSTASFNNNIERIAQKINSTARTKWKNSNNVEPANGTKVSPQHIRFDSSSSDSDSSSSDSSESSTSSNNSTLKNKVVTKKPANNQVKVQNNNNKNKSQQQKKNWKPFNKEEQTNMNPKSLNEFKKVFNRTKLNAPVYGDEEDEIEAPSELEKVEVNSRVNLVDFEKLESFNGMPKKDDKIAFQILEISQNFTPEISNYKVGLIQSFDEHSNEVTLKLDGSSYNDVLNKPNKFTVVEEEDQGEEGEDEDETKEICKKVKDEDEEEDDNILVIEWSSLINVKIFPKESEKSLENEEIEKIGEVLVIVKEKKDDQMDPVEEIKN